MRHTTSSSSPSSRIVFAAAICVVLALATWLRWRYIQDVGLHVDEFSSLWAIRRVLDTGLPLLPSGVYYTRGLFHTYLTAATVELFGFSPVIARLPSLVFGLSSVLLLIAVGRNGWHLGVGVLAGVGLALLPEAIEASGRVRFYAPMLFWALLATWSLYDAVRFDTSRNLAWSSMRGRYLLFAVSFTLAVFSHAESILLYPSFVLGILLWRGPRFLLRPTSLVVHAICVGAIGSRIFFELQGQPGHLATLQSSQPYLTFNPAPMAAWSIILGSFGTSTRLVWTLGGVLALAVALLALYRNSFRFDGLSPFHQSTLFWALQLFGFLLILLLLVGESWHNARYTLIVQGHWILLGAAGLVWPILRLQLRPHLQQLAFALTTCALIAIFIDDAVERTRQRSLGYENAFAFVEANLQPGDVVISPQAAGCALFLGRPCDYYAQGKDYEPFVIKQNGELIDRWSGATLVNDRDRLAAVLSSAPRVWFVIDGDRLLHRFEPDFVQLVMNRFSTVLDDRKARVLFAADHQTEDPLNFDWNAQSVPVTDDFVVVRWGIDRTANHQALAILTEWQVNPTREPPQLSLQLVSQTGARITQADGPLARNMISAAEAEGALVPDLRFLYLPEDHPAGIYRIDAVFYEAATREPLIEPHPIGWLRLGPDSSPPHAAVNEAWHGGIRLFGTGPLPAVLQPGGALPLNLMWQSDEAPEEDWIMFVHLVNRADGSLVAQIDRAPLDGFWPTSAWYAGVQLEDEFSLQLPTTLPMGDYDLLLGWYNPRTHERLLLQDGRDMLPLVERLTVVAE